MKRSPDKMPDDLTPTTQGKISSHSYSEENKKKSFQPRRRIKNADEIEVIEVSIDLEFINTPPLTKVKKLPVPESVSKIAVSESVGKTEQSDSLAIKEKIGSYLALGLLAIYALVLIFGMAHAKNTAEMGEFVKTISQTFGMYLSCIVAYYFGSIASSSTRNRKNKGN